MWPADELTRSGDTHNERLRIPVDATFTVEHEREGAIQELEFQVRWATRTS